MSVYGDPDATTTAPPTTVATTQPAGQAPASTTAADPAPAATKVRSNRSERLDPSGFFLELIADGGTTFKTTDVVRVGLTFTNRSDHVLVYDSNQDLHFALYRDRTPVWTDRDCRPAAVEKPLTGVLELQPGEKGDFVGEYPTRTASMVERCRVAPGEYHLVGYVDWCPDDAIKRSEHNDARYCDREKVRPVQSAPLALTFE